MRSNVLAIAVRDYCDCCWTERCEDEGCAVLLPAGGESSCMSGTRYQTNHGHAGKLCDCLVFWSKSGQDLTGAFELKGGYFQPEKANRQLQEGATVIERLSADFGSVRFVAALVSADELDPLEMRKFNRRRIVFRGQERYPLRISCGSSASSVLLAATKSGGRF